MKVVLDTNVWLDWLVFDDPAVAPLRAAFEAGRLQVLIDAACEEELARVLGYRFYGEVLPDDKQAACLSECRRIATRVEVSSGQPLPSCRDPDDQKFLELALAALERLERDASAWPVHRGEGRSPDRTWREPSLLVAGIAREAARTLGRRYGQNAIVFIDKGAAPELVLLE